VFTAQPVVAPDFTSLHTAVPVYAVAFSFAPAGAFTVAFAAEVSPPDPHAAANTPNTTTNGNTPNRPNLIPLRLSMTDILPRTGQARLIRKG
jgi:hypothetical protein